MGFIVTFPVLDLPRHPSARGGAGRHLRAEAARYRQIRRDLRADWNRAVAALEGARQVAANTPVQVAAARAAAEQAAARYRSGLGAIDEVAEAQRLLTQAEIDDALARLGVWRASAGASPRRRATYGPSWRRWDPNAPRPSRAGQAASPWWWR